MTLSGFSARKKRKDLYRYDTKGPKPQFDLKLQTKFHYSAESEEQHAAYA
jgi:hypothetical protein